ncbi:hypothetical protein Tco_0349794 [Tanacetum coccineum]
MNGNPRSPNNEAIQQSTYYPQLLKNVAANTMKLLEKDATCNQQQCVLLPKKTDNHHTFELETPQEKEKEKVMMLTWNELSSLLRSSPFATSRHQSEVNDQEPRVQKQLPKRNEVVEKRKGRVTEETSSSFPDDTSEKVVHESSSTSDSERTESDTESGTPKGDKVQGENSLVYRTSESKHSRGGVSRPEKAACAQAGPDLTMQKTKLDQTLKDIANVSHDKPERSFWFYFFLKNLDDTVSLWGSISHDPPTKSDPESEHSEQSSDDLSKQDERNDSDMEDTDNAHIPKVSTTTWFKPIPESERPATPEPEWTISPNDFPEPEHNWANAYATTYKVPEEKSFQRKPFHKNSVFLQYQMDECHKLLTNKVDWSNPEGHQILRNIYEPLPLGGPPGQVTIQPQFFFNRDLDYLLTGDKERRIALSISKLKAARYLDFGLEELVPSLWVESEREYNISAVYGITHWCLGGMESNNQQT